MAKTPGVESLVGGLDPDMKRVFVRVFDYVLNNLRIGRPDGGERAENLQAYFIEGTTPAVANTEFSIAHGLGQAPYLLVPVLDLTTVGKQSPRLTVTKAADGVRVYLSSPDTSAPFSAMVEAP
jgi:hypothetical protein